MKTNIGQIDRLLRIVGGSLLLYIAIGLGQTWGYLGIIPLVTGSIGWCPVYRIFGITTQCPKCVTH